MLRVTAWTLGLFGTGAAISRMFPSAWTEPLVLIALGVAFLLVSNRTAAQRAKSGVVTSLPARSPAPASPTPSRPAAVPARASVPVEQSA
jgi:hypothetical protein